MAEMLEITKEGTLKTQIMYKANLSFTQLHEYLDFLINNNLIAQTSPEGKQIYTITQKGIAFLQKHGELIRLIKTHNLKKSVAPP